MITARSRKLHSGHFAFMHSEVMELDASESWSRYLDRGAVADARIVRSTLVWMRNEFAVAAKREAKPGTAWLVLIDAGRLAVDQARLTIEAFALERGMEDFSAAEQVEAFGPELRSSGRALLIACQLEALRWLELLIAEEPKAGDGVAAWLAPAIAARIERAGMPMLFTLIDLINGIGALWWTSVPGIGAGKAERIVQ